MSRSHYHNCVIIYFISVKLLNNCFKFNLLTFPIEFQLEDSLQLNGNQNHSKKKPLKFGEKKIKNYFLNLDRQEFRSHLDSQHKLPTGIQDLLIHHHGTINGINGILDQIQTIQIIT